MPRKIPSALKATRTGALDRPIEVLIVVWVAAFLALWIAGCATQLPSPPSVTVLSCPAIAPLKPPPVLPATHSSPCPAGSKLKSCFDPANDAAAAEDFDLLVKDRDYCRTEYEKLMNR
jgi:hypothetical protein